MITYDQFLNRLIDDGIVAAERDYASNTQKRDGAVEGFNSCRGQSPVKLSEMLVEARRKQQEAFHDDADDYWKHATHAAEVEWVCNCVSAMLTTQNTSPIITPTARGMLKAAEIIGVK